MLPNVYSFHQNGGRDTGIKQKPVKKIDDGVSYRTHMTHVLEALTHRMEGQPAKKWSVGF